MNTSTIVDQAAAVRALAAAATAASRAPSIHNTQPWRWRISGTNADLYGEEARRLDISDPDRRMMLTSCGAALQHACAALAAGGYAFDLTRMPFPDDRHLLARIAVTGRTEVTADAMRLYQTTEIRHTDRRPLLDEPIPDGALDGLRAATAAYGIGIAPLDRDQTIVFAAATDLAQHDQMADESARAEVHTWAGPGRPAGTGIPDANIPATPPPTTVPGRDFGRPGSLDVPQRHDAKATYAILYGVDDEPESWLRAGEALSALWLTATVHQLAVLPLSAAAEEPSTRHMLRRLLSGVGHPYLAVRIGVPDPLQPPPPGTPRLPASATVEVFD